LFLFEIIQEQKRKYCLSLRDPCSQIGSTPLVPQTVILETYEHTVRYVTFQLVSFGVQTCSYRLYCGLLSYDIFHSRRSLRMFWKPDLIFSLFILCILWCCKSWDISGGIVTGYGLDGQVQLPASSSGFHTFQTGSGSHKPPIQ
jgi:hypothetical protein